MMKFELLNGPDIDLEDVKRVVVRGSTLNIKYHDLSWLDVYYATEREALGQSVILNAALRELETSDTYSNNLSESTTSCGSGESTNNLGEDMSVISEFKNFISSYRNIIYTVILIYLVDKFILDGALQSRLRDLLTKKADSALKKLEE